MGNNDKLVKLYTGSKVIISRIKAELEMKGIQCFTRDRYQQGINAGFVDGVPSAIEIFVDESDLEKAKEIVTAITE